MKTIKGFEGLYSVTRDGQVWSHPKNGGRNKGAWLSLIKKDEGYFVVALSKQNTSRHYKVHRLVAQTFLSNPKRLRCVNHVNGVKTDNRVENLEWVTHSQNFLHAIKTGLADRDERGQFRAVAAFDERQLPKGRLQVL